MGRSFLFGPTTMSSIWFPYSLRLRSISIATVVRTIMLFVVSAGSVHILRMLPCANTTHCWTALFDLSDKESSKKEGTMPCHFSTSPEHSRLLLKTTHKSPPILWFLTQNDTGNPRQLTQYSPHTPGRLQKPFTPVSTPS